MKRDKTWWGRRTQEQRSFIVSYERFQNRFYRYGGSGYLPDDITECGVCGYPCSSSPCVQCIKQYEKCLIEKEV